MQVFIVLGETFYLMRDEIGGAYPTDKQWVVGIYPDEIIAKGIVDELTPLADEMETSNAAVREYITLQGHSDPRDTPQWEALTDVIDRLRAKDPELAPLDWDPDEGETVVIRYKILPGEFKQHF